MSETTMPAAEAEGVTEHDDERSSYELAFHVLPTVAEGEVPTVLNTIKDQITKLGGTPTDEEMPERFDLAYEIMKHIDGKNRKFDSAYFGWVRFSAEPKAAASLAQSIESDSQILRHILIRLTKVEEEHPFRLHEALKDQKMVSTVEESEVVPDFTTVNKSEETAQKETKEEGGEVDDEELEKALEEKKV